MLKRIAAVCLCFFPTTIHGQAADPAKAEALFKAGKVIEALPLYQELAKQLPSEMIYQDHLALCLIGKADQEDDSARRKSDSMMAQEAAKQAIALGDTSYVIQMLAKRDFNAAASVRQDTPARSLLREGEKLFVAADFAAALAKYAEAADADPKLYEAPLYAGDAAFKERDYAVADRWYRRAVSVDLNRETGYRYSGDAILATSMMGDRSSPGFKVRTKMLDPIAKGQYLDAIVAEPYKSISWEGIKKWAKLRNATLQAPKIDRPAAPTVDPKDPEKIAVTIDASKFDGKSKDAATAWIMYSIIRADYLKERFKKEFPDEKAYRHSLREESYALGMVVKTAKDKNVKPEDMDESLRNLIEVSDAGMLECWILINGADRGIVEDYAGFREEHRKLLHDYLDRFVVHPSAAE